MAPVVPHERGRFDLVIRGVLALAAGAVGGAAFPPRTSTWLLVASVAGLIALVLRQPPRRAALIGLLFGLGWFGVVVRWADVVGWDAWVILALACAVFIAVMAMGLAAVARLPLAPLWIAAVWVLQESVRSTIPFGGFPWGRVVDGSGLAWADALTFGGFSYVTFLLVLAAATVVVIVDTAIRRRGELDVIAVVALSNLAVLALVLLLPQVAAAVVAEPEPRGSTTIAVVQGDVPGEGLDFLGRERAVLKNHVRETEKLAAAIRSGSVERPSLVVWPENSTDIDPITDPQARALVEGAVDAVGVPILLGTVLETDDPTRIQNAAVLWDPTTGPRVVYVKQRPVPFGEFVPLRSSIAPLISRFNRVPRDFVAGRDPGVVTVGNATLGLAICFEVAHDDIQRSTVQDGADVLVVLTNNATYSTTNQPDQQFSITRQRSAELHRSTVVAATTGITAVVTPTGAVQAQLPEREPGYLVERVELSGARTPALVAGQGIETGLAIVGVLAVIIAVTTGRRRPQGATAQRQEQA